LVTIKKNKRKIFKTEQKKKKKSIFINEVLLNGILKDEIECMNLIIIIIY